MTPVEQWTDQLEAWRIPPAILEAAPRDPYGFPPAMSRRASVDPRSTPTGRVVSEVLDPGERLLDVGCGGGRVAGVFAADHDVVGIEPRPGLADAAREAGITVLEGRWPEMAAAAGHAPVVLSTHVLYDVQTPVPFLVALDDAATRRVVLEVTALHPWVRIGPLYQLVHGIDRPHGPSAELLVEVVTQAIGRRPQVEWWSRPGGIHDDADALVDHTRRMVCIDATHPAAPALDAAALDGVTQLDDGSLQMPAVDQATIWWDIGA